MEVIYNIAWIVLILSLIGLIICAYLLYRNRKVYEFDRMRLEIWREYMYNHFGSDIHEMEWFIKKYSHDQLLFSTKPLKLEYWFTKEELDKICN